jgi:hypothetical protein
VRAAGDGGGVREERELVMGGRGEAEVMVFDLG